MQAHKVPLRLPTQTGQEVNPKMARFSNSVAVRGSCVQLAISGVHARIACENGDVKKCTRLT